MQHYFFMQQIGKLTVEGQMAMIHVLLALWERCFQKESKRWNSLLVKVNISNLVLCWWHITFFKRGTFVVFTLSCPLSVRQHKVLWWSCTCRHCHWSWDRSLLVFWTRYFWDGLRQALLLERIQTSAVVLTQQEAAVHNMNFLSPGKIDFWRKDPSIKFFREFIMLLSLAGSGRI